MSRPTRITDGDLLALSRSVTLIPGDGVGKEITQSVEEIFEVGTETDTERMTSTTIRSLQI